MLLAAQNELFADKRRLANSFFVQVFATVVVGTLVPAFLWFGAETAFVESASIRTSILGSVFAALFGVFSARQVYLFPGVRLFASIIPTFIASFGLVAIGILVLRVPYSIPVFGVNFVTCLLYTSPSPRD